MPLPSSFPVMESQEVRKVADKPFNDASGGDCWLKSSDEVLFKVYRVVLSLASPVFEDMFGLPQTPNTPETTDDKGMPIIQLLEPASTLRTLLLMIYPGDPPPITSYDSAVSVIDAFDKYMMSVKRLCLFLHDVFSSKDALENHPLDVYALAWRLGMEEEAKTASRYTHSYDLSSRPLKRELVQRSGNVESLLALWEMRRKRENAFGDLLLEAHLQDRSCNSNHAGYSYKVREMDLADAQMKYLQIRTATWNSVNVPYPNCDDLKDFFGLSAFSLGSLRDCRDCMHQAATGLAQECKRVNEALSEFPQTIDRIVRD